MNTHAQCVDPANPGERVTHLEAARIEKEQGPLGDATTPLTTSCQIIAPGRLNRATDSLRNIRVLQSFFTSGEHDELGKELDC